MLKAESAAFRRRRFCPSILVRLIDAVVEVAFELSVVRVDLEHTGRLRFLFELFHSLLDHVRAVLHFGEGFRGLSEEKLSLLKRGSAG